MVVTKVAADLFPFSKKLGGIFSRPGSLPNVGMILGIREDFASQRSLPGYER
jgi:hypothetical protein